VSSPELVSLGLGILIGLVVGAMVFGLLTRRSRKPEVRVTITPNALPGREPTSGSGPSVGGQQRAGIPVEGGQDPVLRELASAGAGVLHPTDPDRVPLAVGAASARYAAEVESVGSADVGTERTAALASAEGTQPEAPAPVAGGVGRPDPLAAEVPGAGTAVDAALSGDGPCRAEQRALAERSAVALRAREAHRRALDELRATQRAYDEAGHAVDQATRAIDGRFVLEEKSAAQQRFRLARMAATSQADLETAARDWLAEISRVNVAVRDGAATVARGREQAGRLLVALERASARVDATRISAETAEADAGVARQALVDCQEEHLGRGDAAAFAALATTPAGGEEPGADEAHQVQAGPPGAFEGAASLTAEAEEQPPASAPSVLVRILRGDGAMQSRVVAVLAGGSAGEARRWDDELTALVDAINRAAIDESAIELPAGHPFWSAFSEEHAHEIARALGNLGYRFDGRGGFEDERHPSMRDLSLAIGYTGLDSSRTRIWPTEAEMAELYRGARVASDRFVMTGAPDLTLGQMIALLGRGAESLTPLWDEWGRVRPLLASTAP